MFVFLFSVDPSVFDWLELLILKWGSACIAHEWDSIGIQMIVDVLIFSWMFALCICKEYVFLSKVILWKNFWNRYLYFVSYILRSHNDYFSELFSNLIFSLTLTLNLNCLCQCTEGFCFGLISCDSRAVKCFK